MCKFSHFCTIWVLTLDRNLIAHEFFGQCKPTLNFVFFYLWRLCRTMNEPFRSRAKSQLRLILQFRGTQPPPPNTPMRLIILDHIMQQQFRRWLLGFTFHHQIQFPPFHKVRAPIVAVKGTTLGRVCFNFRNSLRWWNPSWKPVCTCAHFPLHVQCQLRSTTHISCFAAHIADCPLFAAHMEDELLPTKANFLSHNTQAFERFLHQWRLPSGLMQYWQYFLTQEWERFHQDHDSASVWTLPAVRRDLNLLRHWIISPSDHFPHSLTVHCPCQWHELLQKTFLDAAIFERCSQPAGQVLCNLEQQLPDLLRSQYSWWIDFKRSTLSKGYILPKPSRGFAKARPIVDYSTAWSRKLGSALSTILIAILNAVFGSILEFAHVQDVITGISALFSMEDFAETAFSLRQGDIAGFYNQVEHDRILLAIQFALFTFASQCEQGLDTVMQSHVVRLERILRVFQGSWREKTKQYMTITLRDIPSLVQYLLDHSYFTVGSQVLRQRRGASMGSQFAPVLCSAVALQREWNFAMSFSPFTWDRSLHHRYVDNRALLISRHSRKLSHIQVFWNLQFYSAPILLEVVAGQEALGFHLDTLQQTITLELPWNKPLRSIRSASTSRAILSGLCARLRLIRFHVFQPKFSWTRFRIFWALCINEFLNFSLMRIYV